MKRPSAKKISALLNRLKEKLPNKLSVKCVSKSCLRLSRRRREYASSGRKNVWPRKQPSNRRRLLKSKRNSS